MAKQGGKVAGAVASDELAAARAELAAAEAELAAERDAHAGSVELARIKREAADAKRLAQAERELGPLTEGAYGYVRTRLGVVVVKPPNEILWKRYQDRPAPSEEQTREFIDTCRFAPEPDEYGRILSELPGTVGALALLIPKLAGYDPARVVGGKE